MVSGNWHLADTEKRPPFPVKNIDVHYLWYLAALRRLGNLEWKTLCRVILVWNSIVWPHLFIGGCDFSKIIEEGGSRFSCKHGG